MQNGTTFSHLYANGLACWRSSVTPHSCDALVADLGARWYQKEPNHFQQCSTSDALKPTEPQTEFSKCLAKKFRWNTTESSDKYAITRFDPSSSFSSHVSGTRRGLTDADLEYGRRADIGADKITVGGDNRTTAADQVRHKARRIWIITDAELCHGRRTEYGTEHKSEDGGNVITAVERDKPQARRRGSAHGARTSQDGPTNFCVLVIGGFLNHVKPNVVMTPTTYNLFLKVFWFRIHLRFNTFDSRVTHLLLTTLKL